MSNPLNNISRSMHRSAAISPHNAELERLRTDNPGYKIMKPDIYDTHLGKSAPIYDQNFLYQVRIGIFSYVLKDSNLNNVKAGNLCPIGPNVQIGLAPHPSKIIVSKYLALDLFLKNRYKTSQ